MSLCDTCKKAPAAFRCSECKRGQWCAACADGSWDAHARTHGDGDGAAASIVRSAASLDVMGSLSQRRLDTTITEMPLAPEEARMLYEAVYAYQERHLKLALNAIQMYFVDFERRDEAERELSKRARGDEVRVRSPPLTRGHIAAVARAADVTDPLSIKVVDIDGSWLYIRAVSPDEGYVALGRSPLSKIEVRS